jgi:hypothetical protein
MLFKDYIRFDAAPLKSKESSFDFLERSSWRRCGLVREMLNDWIIPMLSDAEFISQIKSNNNKQHYAALFELLFFTLFKRQGFDVTKHPEVPRKTRPDFQVKNEAGFSAYMECTLSGSSFETLDEENRKAAVEEIIREIEYYPYYINLDFLTISKKSISKKALLNFIDAVKDKSEGIENEELFHIRHYFENNDWELEVSLIRKPDLSRKVSLGYISGKAKTIEHTKSIFNALNDKKPSKYGLTGSTYIICINNKDMFFKDEDMNEVLFGYDGPKINLSYGSEKGFFHCDGKPINTSVSAVLLFKGMDILTLSNTRISLWHNPFAKFPVPLGTMSFDEYYYEKDGHYLTKNYTAKSFNIFETLLINEKSYTEDPKVSEC